MTRSEGPSTSASRWRKSAKAWRHRDSGIRFGPRLVRHAHGAIRSTIRIERRQYQARNDIAEIVECGKQLCCTARHCEGDPLRRSECAAERSEIVAAQRREHHVEIAIAISTTVWTQHSLDAPIDRRAVGGKDFAWSERSRNASTSRLSRVIQLCARLATFVSGRRRGLFGDIPEVLQAELRGRRRGELES
jgi:hypothetical protein